MSEITITIKIDGAEAVLAPLIASIDKLTKAFTDHSDILYLMSAPRAAAPVSAPVAIPPAPAAPVFEAAETVFTMPQPPKAAFGAAETSYGKWSKERIDLLLLLHPQKYHEADILIALNNLPGDQLANSAIRDRVKYEKKMVAEGKTGMRLADLKGHGGRRFARRPVVAVPGISQQAIAPKIYAAPAARPAPGQKIDASTADLLIARDAAGHFDSPIDFQALSDWADANKIDIAGFTREGALKKVNMGRHILGLPPWRLIATRGHHDKLPAPSFGASTDNNYSKPTRA